MLISLLLLLLASVAVTDIDFKEFVYSDMMSQMSVIFESNKIRVLLSN